MTSSCRPKFVSEKQDRCVCVIGAPLSHGQTLQGVNRAPEQLRQSGLRQMIESLDWKLRDLGDLQFPQKRAADSPSPPNSNPEANPSNPEYADIEVRHCKVIGSACGQIADAAKQAAQRGEFVLTVGGDHSVACGSISGLLTVYPSLVVVWVDAHGDINTPEISLSHSYHGMPVAHLLGLFGKRAPGFEWMNGTPPLKPENFTFIGLRDLDPEERLLINKSEIAAYSMKDVDSVGISTVVKNALAKIDPQGNRPIHLSFDIDGCDPSVAPGTGTKARGGLSYREAHYICESLHDTKRLVSMDIVEVNPDLDQPDEVHHGDSMTIAADTTKTVRLGLELISSVLGKAIL